MNLLDKVPREVSLQLIGFDSSDFFEVNLVRLKGNNWLQFFLQLLGLQREAIFVSEKRLDSPLDSRLDVFVNGIIKELELRL